MKSDGFVPVAIVGGGFSGTILAAQLARRGIQSVVIEKDGRAGLGAAFSTRDPVHLLNIPAETMGAWAGEPEDFVMAEGIERGSYAERRQFGRYLRRILDEAVADGHCQVASSRAIGAVRKGGRWLVELEGGETVGADALVIATGNQTPQALPGLEGAGRRLINDPWSEQARAAIDDAAVRKVDVLILGASLTMIDVALSLASAGHKGRIVALSRRGKIPLSNGTDEPTPAEWDELPRARVRDIARWLRRRSAETGWRPAIDSLRPHSHRLWQTMPLEQKRLFLRFGRPWWDIHRHRVAPEIGEKIQRLIGSGQLQVIGGRITGAHDLGDAIAVSIRKRGEDNPEPQRQFGYIFNCTGPLHAIERTRDPLLRALLDSGDVRADQLGIGLETDEISRVGERLWALGSLTKGRYWEIIAVPDIRDQAAAVADDIARELSE
jgi:uncharacterized NAD(P)/FAD-binding protein YdhS